MLRETSHPLSVQTSPPVCADLYTTGSPEQQSAVHNGKTGLLQWVRERGRWGGGGGVAGTWK